MATELTLPDMGEGIEDITINRWLVSVGGDVKEGDIIVEVATDKVDTEIAAPASGKLLAIHVKEGALVPVSTVLGVIGAEGESVKSNGSEAPIPPEEKQETKSDTSEEKVASAEDAAASSKTSSSPVDTEEVKATPVAKRVAAEKGVSLEQIVGSGTNGQITKQDVLDYDTSGSSSGAKSSGVALPDELADVPSLIVRRAAAENDINLEAIADGRSLSTLTKYDVLSAVASEEAGKTVEVEPRFQPPAGWTQSAAASTASPKVVESTLAETAPVSDTAAAPKPATSTSKPPVKAGSAEELVKPNRMRQLIAKNTLESQQSAPQLTTMWDVDMSAVLAHRKANKAAFAKDGVNLTVTAYLMMATVAGLRSVPAANATWTDEGILIKRYYNVGMAAALPMDQHGIGGLIVPVVKNAGDLNLLGMARAVNELAEKSRSNALTATDLQGATFTLTNYGTSGSRFQTPIINQPQSGILGVGAIEKRPIVVSNGHPLVANSGDYLIFKPMTTLGFTYDHRVLDGASADAYCAAVKNELENWK